MLLTPNITGGAVFVWQDNRDPLTGPDRYQQTVKGDRVLAAPRPVVLASRPSPAEASRQVVAAR